MQLSKIFRFVALAFGISWGAMLIPRFIPITEQWQMLLLVIVVLFGPALAAIILRLFTYKGSLSEDGLFSKSFQWKWFWASAFFPILALFGSFGVIYVLGNILQLPGFGEVVMAHQGVSLSVTELFYQAASNAFGSVEELLLPFTKSEGYLPSFSLYDPSTISDSSTLITLLIIIGISLLAGLTINGVFMLGQELGFRGFLLGATRPLGFLGGNLVIGFLQGLWYLPFVLNSPNPFTNFMVLMGISISTAFPLAYVALKSNSVFSAAVFRGVLSTVAIASFLFVYGADPLVGSLSGVAGMIAFLVLTFLIIYLDPDFVEEYREKEYGKS
ncbi:MAG: hypothetical protein AAGI38_01735 [Bacteroidota bacterium]